MTVKQVSDASFEADVLKNDKPVLVDFWAPWCGPCRMLGPVIEELAGEYADKISIAKVNTDENVKTASQFGISGIPCMIFFKNGQEAGRLVGFMPKPQIEAKIKEIIG